MSLTGLILGVINIAIVVGILLLIGAIIMWFCSWMGLGIPANVQKGYIIVAIDRALHARQSAFRTADGSRLWRSSCSNRRLRAARFASSSRNV
jgi:hypothetical protein